MSIDVKEQNPLPYPKETVNIGEDQLRMLTRQEYAKYLEKLVYHLPNEEARAISFKYLPILLVRFISDTSKPPDPSFIESEVAHDIGEKTGHLLHLLATPGGPVVSPQILEGFYNCLHSPQRTTQYSATNYIGTIIILDNRNKTSGEYLGLIDRYHQDFVQKLKTIKTNKDVEFLREMIDPICADFGDEALWELFRTTLNQTDSIDHLKLAFRLFANRFGIENLRQRLQTYAAENSVFQTKWAKLETSLNLNPAQKPQNRLQEVYQSIDFTEYKPNQELNDFEINLLLKRFKDNKNILDIACGIGRLLLALKNQGKDVTGLDFMEKHAENIHSLDPGAKVVVAGWHQMPFAQETFDFAYCLGRSFSHNTTPDQGLCFLRETSRVLTQNGKLIIDIPDISQGDYAREQKRLDEAARNQGIYYKEHGTIIDSPDQVHYFDRFIPTSDQFEAMALLAGFKAEVIATKEYQGVSGEKNTNIYWQLTKRDKLLSTNEIAKYAYKLRTGGPPLFWSFV